jgi:type VI secretion system FHA domain protein
MILTLEVTGPSAAKLGAARRKVFNASGGTIGRLRDNQWSLPDPYVSNRHAVIRYQDGAFYIEDTSTNGVFINSPENRLVKGQLYPLKSSDWIFIEPYEIRATIESGAKEAAASPHDWAAGSIGPSPARHEADFDDPFQPVPRARSAKDSAAPLPAELIPGGEEVDPLNLIGVPGRRTPQPPAPRAADLARGSVVSDHYQPPAPRFPEPSTPPAGAPGPLIPEDYNPIEGDEHSAATPSSARPHAAPSQRARSGNDDWAAPPPPSTPAAPVSLPPPRRGASKPSAAPQAAPPAADAAIARAPRVDLSEMLRGAGLDPGAVTPELAQNFGRILRVVVAGVMDVLQARQKIKSEFRIGMTTFKPADNNPLKFSANVDDALHNLLVKRNAAYLPPVEAFEDAFDDVRNHQMAMLAGLRVAFEAMLAQFDPDRLQEQFDRQLKTGALLSAPAKLRYWDLYRQKIHDMVKDPDASFRELFGDEFANAYEEQLKRLKARNRAVEP